MQNEPAPQPLAAKLRPETLDDIIGQEHILTKNSPLYRALRTDVVQSIIFYGPPGTGKTTIARVIANITNSDFQVINATTAGKKDLENVTFHAGVNYRSYGQGTIVFIDEIHRFNKSQQDYLLPYVEDGTIRLIGATTENPYFEVNRALVSRSLIFELKPLVTADLVKLLQRALPYTECTATPDALEAIACHANGDARIALNLLEYVSSSLPTTTQEITIEYVHECLPQMSKLYDKDGEYHHDVISAFIKSMRGSDPNATVLWLAYMLESGEDIKFIARRIMICAAEDVGLADPQALQVATAASLAVERLGMPEARIPLAEAALYVAKAPKSNYAYKAIEVALKRVQNTPNIEVPNNLKNHPVTRTQEYLYPHDYPNHYVEQQYLPDVLKDWKFENDFRKGW